MTVCNMSIEGGARAGLIAPDEKTFAYLKGRPQGAEGRGLGQAIATGRRCTTDDGARFDREVRLDAAKLPPIVTWGTSPEDVVPVDGTVPDPTPTRRSRPSRRSASARSTTWASSRARRSRTSPSSASSSAPAPTAASRICAPPPR